MVSSNNAINNTVGASISGVTNLLTITNPSNTASSAARETVTVGGTTAGNPTRNWNIVGSTDFEMGIDNADSQKLKIAQSTALGTKDVWRMTTAGQRTMPLQPAFLAYLSTNQANVTGDGTQYTVIFDTVAFQQGAGYNNGTGVFTAPVTGYYAFTFYCRIFGITAAHTDMFLQIATPAGLFRGAEFNAAAVRSTTSVPSNLVSFCTQCMVNLTAADTVSCQIAVFQGTKVVTVSAQALYLTSFSGVLLC